jgi:FRG domain
MFPPEVEELKSWSAVTAAFDEFPPPTLDFDWEGELSRSVWAFRGHKKLSYPLRPSIERAAEGKYDLWAALEAMILAEFQLKARLHMDSRDLPPLDQRLSWLALMQHHAIPTRLLDVTTSPYVALYFAIRDRSKEEQNEPAAVWAFHASALRERAERIGWRAEWAQSEHDGRPASHGVSLNPIDFATELDTFRHDESAWQSICENALVAKGARRACYKENGFVAFALPPIQNQRLSSQQGAFLFNGAEKLTFEESLSKLMDQHDAEWCRLFSIPAEITQEVERRLFQMNVHDLSMFPDMTGLTGLIRQKTQLHWLVPE